MKKIILLLLLIFNFTFSFSQPFSVGTTTLTFNDISRANRQVPCDIYYPATTSGLNTPLAQSTTLFKVVLIAHGFFMGTDAYISLSQKLAKEGFIVAVLNTENSISPNHLEFGKDIAFAIKSLNELSTVTGNFFYNNIEPRSAVTGHSMGGGASFLAIQYNSEIKALINFAAAETSPSAIASSTTINIPTLIYAGSKDCVAPPANHQQIMYDSLTSSCKTLITITDGTHCQFADNNFACSAGESTCLLGSSFITRAQQYELIDQTLFPFLKGILDNNVSAWNLFMNTVSSSDSITYLQSCSNSPLSINNNEVVVPKYKIYPNPTTTEIEITSCTNFSNVKLFSFELKKVIELNFNSTKNTLIDVSKLSSGIYFLKIDKQQMIKLIINN